MPLWMLIMLLALIKIPIAALLLWLPFRNDEALRLPNVSDSSDEDGGSLTLPGGPGGPQPHLPGGRPGGGARPQRRRSHPAPASRRRDPHRTPLPSAPRRIRTTASGSRIES